MIETPEAVKDIDAIAAAADFVCIGTNDLAAFVLGGSRGGAERALDPRVLVQVAAIVRGAHARGRKVTVCGEIAADPRGACLLVGLGVDALSVAAGRLGEVALALRDASKNDCERDARAALDVLETE